jgi:hypothetical protein
MERASLFQIRVRNSRAYGGCANPNQPPRFADTSPLHIISLSASRRCSILLTVAAFLSAANEATIHRGTPVSYVGGGETGTDRLAS